MNKSYAQPSLFELGSSEPLGPRYDGTTMDKQQLHAGPGGSMTSAHDNGWSGVCACGKSARDGIRCKLGATHAP